MTRFVLMVLCAALCAATSVRAQDVEALRADFQRQNETIERLKTEIPENEKTIAELRATLAARTARREKLVAAVSAQRDALLDRKAEIAIRRRIAVRRAEDYGAQWREVERVPQAFSAQARREIRQNYANAREELGRVTEMQERVARDLAQRSDALRAAEFDVAFLEQNQTMWEEIAERTEANRVRLSTLTTLLEDIAKTTEAFMTLADDHAPPIIQSVQIAAEDDVFYAAVWEQFSYSEPPENLSCGAPPVEGRPAVAQDAVRASRELAELQGLVTRYIDSLKPPVALWRLKLETRNKTAQLYLEQQISLNKRYAEIATEIADFEQLNLLLQTATSIAQVGLEVGLTFGAAGAMATASEAVLEAAAEKAFNRMQETVTRTAWRARGQTVEELREAFVAEYIQRMPAADVMQRHPRLNGQQAAAFARQAFDDVREAMAEARFPLVERMGVEALERRFSGKATAQLLRRGLTPEIQSAMKDRLRAQGVDVDAQIERTIGVLTSEAFSFALDRALLAGAVGVKNVLNTSPRLRNLSREASMMTPDRASDLIPNSPQDLLRLAPAVVKAGIEYFFAGKIGAAQRRALETMAQSQMIATAYNELNRDRFEIRTELADMEDLIAEAEAELAAIRKGGELTRRLVAEVNRTIEDPDADYRLTVVFAGPGVMRPTLRIGAEDVSAEPQGGLPAATWTFRLPADALAAIESETITFRVAAADANGRALDGSPWTTPFPKIRGEGFHLYDAAADFDDCYTVAVDLQWPVTLAVDDMVRDYQVKRR